MRFPKSNYRVTNITMDRLFLSIFPEGEVFRFGEEVKHVLEDCMGGLGGGGFRKVHVISAAKGMGKSKAIRKTVGTAATAALNITFRRSLARSSSADIPGCLVYMDHDDLDEAMTAGKPMTVLINSLLRISPSVHASPKVIVLDEWVSILEMLGSELIDDQKRYQIIKRLHQLLQFAETIIVSDALLDCDSLVCLRAFLESGAGAGAAGLGKVAYDIALYDYAHKPHAFHEFIHHAKLEEWMARLVDSVLGCNRKVVIPCMTKAFALRMYEMVKDWGRQVLLYTSDSCADMLATSLSNINDAWAGCDILIYSPVITAGCSFEIRSHFDECFLYAYQGTASVRSALQMMFRVRDLSHLKVHIHLEKGSMADFTQVHDLVVIHPRCFPGLASIDDASAYPLVINDHIMRLRKVRELDRRFCFGSAFWDLLRRSGARIVGDPLASEKCVQESTTIAVRQVREDLAKVPPRRSRIHLGDLLDEGIIEQEHIDLQVAHVPPPDPFFDSQANEFDPERWCAFMYAMNTMKPVSSLPASVTDDAAMAKLANKVRDKIIVKSHDVPPNLVFESLSPRLWPLSVATSTGSTPSPATGSTPSLATGSTPSPATGSYAVLFRIPFYECDNVYAQLAESILGTIFCLAIGWNGSLDGNPITLTITIENVVCRKLVSASVRVVNPYKALSLFVSGGKLRRPMNNYERVQRMVSRGQGIASELLRSCFVRHINVWARAKLQNRGIERIEDKDLVAIEPMDPTICGGNWEDPMSMALAFSIGTHALVHLKIATYGFSLLVPCDPLLLIPGFHPTEKPEC